MKIGHMLNFTFLMRKQVVRITYFSFIVFYELLRFLGVIETDNPTVSNSEIITRFQLFKNRVFLK